MFFTQLSIVNRVDSSFTVEWQSVACRAGESLSRMTFPLGQGVKTVRVLLLAGLLPRALMHRFASTPVADHRLFTPPGD